MFFIDSLPGPIWKEALLGALADSPATSLDYSLLGH